MDSLPVELFDLVLMRLTRAALLSLAQTCCWINLAVEPHLYDTVIIRSAANLRAFHSSLRAQPRRAGLVRNFLIKRASDTYRTSHRAGESAEEADYCMLPALEKLVTLSIESYYLDSNEFNHVFARAARGEILTCLKTCRLCFLDGSGRRHPLHRFDSVLLHPSLETLTIYNVRDGCRDHVHCQQRSTKLRNLELLNSDLSVDELAKLLAIPRQLKSLVIHSKSQQSPVDHCPTDCSEYASALQVVAECLETLVVERDFGFYGNPLKLGAMTALRHGIDDSYLWLGTLMPHPDWIDEPLLREIIPPTLEHVGGYLWAYVPDRAIDEAVITKVLATMRKVAPAVKLELYSPYGVSERFKRACIAARFPITYTYEECDENEYEYNAAGFLRKAHFLSLPVGPID
ncbi:f-box domain cyclin-like protein [Diplodia corticola]|uniref:F-box domain cyclin-like protein n=1 Tax=Diplodia corticola TaxID=236234 RepID=A0A1J9RYD3_9PEZI|nr:f-box domain cyclin-like protein [Diplodia corticola]OJD33359.1 f-box domain cyclin-like protein [Diplodia corticola]